MTDLFLPVCSITSTKRRRFLWAVWTSGPPTHVPFRKPDLSAGGAATHEEAVTDAERRVGSSVVLIDALWARAWIRVMRGEPVWPSKASREPRPSAPTKSSIVEESVWSILGVARDVTPEALKAAYRRRALETHPDTGGDDEAFRRIVRAYEEAERRLRKRGLRR